MTDPRALEAAREYAATTETLAAETRECLHDIRRTDDPREVADARNAAVAAAGAAALTARQAEDAAGYVADAPDATEVVDRARQAAGEARGYAEAARVAADRFAAR